MKILSLGILIGGLFALLPAQEISLDYEDDSFNRNYYCSATIILNKNPDIPVLDGRIEEKCWEKATHISNLSRIDEKIRLLAQVKTDVYLYYNDEYLYIACHCHEPRPDKIRKNTKVRDGDVWHDDCIELFIDSEGDGKNYFHIGVNPAGILADAKIKNDSAIKDISQKCDYAWNSYAKTVSRIGKKSWSTEIAIPLAALGGKNNAIWRFNVTRARRTGKFVEYSSFAQLYTSFHQPENFALLIFRKAQYTVQNILWSDFYRGTNRIGMKIRNEDNFERNVKICLNDDCYATLIKAGEEKEIFPTFQLKNSVPWKLTIQDAKPIENSHIYFSATVSRPYFPALLVLNANKLLFAGEKLKLKLKIGFSKEDIIRLGTKLRIQIFQGEKMVLTKEFNTLLSSSLSIIVNTKGMNAGQYLLKAEVIDNSSTISQNMNFKILETDY